MIVPGTYIGLLSHTLHIVLWRVSHFWTLLARSPKEGSQPTSSVMPTVVFNSGGFHEPYLSFGVEPRAARAASRFGIDHLAGRRRCGGRWLLESETAAFGPGLRGSAGAVASGRHVAGSGGLHSQRHPVVWNQWRKWR